MRPSPALVVALIALFVSIGGVGYAASKIGTNDIQNGAVTTPKLHKNAVTAEKIKPLSVITGKLNNQAVVSNKLADASVTNTKLGPDSVSVDKIQDSAVRASELGSTSQVLGSQVTIAANGTQEATATCPAGSQVISGGGFATNFGVHLVTSFQSGNGWHVAYQNTTATARAIQAIAVCLNA